MRYGLKESIFGRLQKSLILWVLKFDISGHILAKIRFSQKMMSAILVAILLFLVLYKHAIAQEKPFCVYYKYGLTFIY